MGGVLKFERDPLTFFGGGTFGRPLALSGLGAACLLCARKHEELWTRNAAAPHEGDNHHERKQRMGDGAWH